jgi:hypothetical protein
MEISMAHSQQAWLCENIHSLSKKSKKSKKGTNIFSIAAASNQENKSVPFIIQ